MAKEKREISREERANGKPPKKANKKNFDICKWNAGETIEEYHKRNSKS